MYSWLQIKNKRDLLKLTKLISSEFDPQGIADKLQLGISSAVKSVLIEKNYIDKDYRSTYYHFYSKKGRYYRLDCVRLHFFDETISFDTKTQKLVCDDPHLSDHYFGYMVLRPTGLATIGRSILSPDVRKGTSGFTISTSHKVHVLGYTLEVKGFPSMDQHVDIAVCAHVACWSILRHYSIKYKVYQQFLTHDITLMAQSFNPGGIIPSKGLEVSHAERVMQEAGTFPIHIAKNGPNDVSFYRQLIAYIESGFPLFAAMNIRSHAIAIIGHSWKKSTRWSKLQKKRYAWDEVESLTVVDDNHLPYLSISKKSGKDYSTNDIDAFIVALPEKIFYPADAVDSYAQGLFKLSKLVSLPPIEKTIIRYFLTTGSKLRSFMRSRESEFDPELINIVMSLPFAQFIWLIEYATEDQWRVGQITARAILDGTASLRENYPLWLFHGKDKALVFDRSNVGNSTDGMGVLVLNGMEDTALTRMEQNLRPTKSK